MTPHKQRDVLLYAIGRETSTCDALLMRIGNIQNKFGLHVSTIQKHMNTEQR
jgi:hypothetical protein